MTATSGNTSARPVATASDHIVTIDWPLALALAGTITTPVWLPTLKDTSDFLGVLAPLVGVVVLLYKIVAAWRESRKTPTAEEAGTAGAAALTGASAGIGKMAVASSKTAMVAAGVVAVFAAIAMLFASTRAAKAEPAPPIAGTRQPARAARRRSDDAAGDDGDVPVTDATAGEPRWLALARAELGVREWAGKRANPRVVQYYADAGHPGVKSDEVSWCGAFVSAMLERAGVDSAKSLLARDYMRWGRAVDEPTPGCVVVFWRGSRSGWQGHVGFYVGETADHVLCLGGNQSDGVSVARFPKSRVLGYRLPRPLTRSGTVRGAVAAAAGSAGAGVATTAELAGLAARAPVKSPAAGHEMPPETHDGATGLMRTLGDALEPVATYSRWIAIVCAALATAGALYAIYHRIQIRRETGR